MDDKERKQRLRFSLAATNMPSVNLSEENLSLSFIDWEGKKVCIDFQSTIAFRWFNNVAECMTIDDDVAYEIHKSQWINELQDLFPEVSQSEKRLRHYKFCIYNCWVLEVACESFQY